MTFEKDKSYWFLTEDVFGRCFINRYLCDGEYLTLSSDEADVTGMTNEQVLMKLNLFDGATEIYYNPSDPYMRDVFNPNDDKKWSNGITIIR